MDLARMNTPRLGEDENDADCGGQCRDLASRRGQRAERECPSPRIMHRRFDARTTDDRFGLLKMQNRV